MYAGHRLERTCFLFAGNYCGKVGYNRQRSNPGNVRYVIYGDLHCDNGDVYRREDGEMSEHEEHRSRRSYPMYKSQAS